MHRHQDFHYLKRSTCFYRGCASTVKAHQAPALSTVRVLPIHVPLSPHCLLSPAAHVFTSSTVILLLPKTLPSLKETIATSHPSVLVAPQYAAMLVHEICFFLSSPLMLQRWHPAVWAVLGNPPPTFGCPWASRHFQSSAPCCQQCLSLEVVQLLTSPCLAMLRRIQSMQEAILFISKILPFRQEAVHKKK